MPCSPMKEAYNFMCQKGITKPSFHVMNRLDWFFLDRDNKITIPSTEAIITEKVKVINQNELFTDYWTRNPYIMISVTQQGYKVGNYAARVIIKLDTVGKIVRVDTFEKPGPLFFEAIGKVLETKEIIDEGLAFVGGEKKAAPKVIVRSIISTRDPGYRANESRGLFVTKEL